MNFLLVVYERYFHHLYTFATKFGVLTAIIPFAITVIAFAVYAKSNYGYLLSALTIVLSAGPQAILIKELLFNERFSTSVNPVEFIPRLLAYLLIFIVYFYGMRELVRGFQTNANSLVKTIGALSIAFGVTLAPLYIISFVWMIYLYLIIGVFFS